MKPITTTAQFRNTLETAIKSESEAIFIASAYIKAEAMRWLLAKSSLTSEITVVGRFLPNDFLSGASDLEVIEHSLSEGLRIGLDQNLHSKVYSFKQQNLVLVGSFNLTMRGVGLSENSNHEAGVAIKPTLQNDYQNAIKNHVTWIDNELLLRMKTHLSEHENSNAENRGLKWPENIVGKLPRRRKYLSTDFPDILPEEVGERRSLFIPNEFENRPGEFYNNCEINHWLIDLLNVEIDRKTNFGWLSSKIHDALLDEPIPSRADVKEICNYLIQWIEAYSEAIQVIQHQHTKSLHLNSG